MAVQINALQLIVVGEVSRAGVSVGSSIIKAIKDPKSPLYNATDQSVYRAIEQMKKKGVLKDVEPSRLAEMDLDGHAKKAKPTEITQTGREKLVQYLEEAMSKVLQFQPKVDLIVTFSRMLPEMEYHVQVGHLRKLHEFRHQLKKEIEYQEQFGADETADVFNDPKYATLSTRDKFDLVHRRAAVTQYRQVDLPLVEGVIQILLEATPELANVSI